MMSTRIPRYLISVGVAVSLLAFVLLPVVPAARRNFALASQATTATPTDDVSLLDGYRHVEVASVSDAMEKVTGKRAYMSHRMRPIFLAKFAGFAVTVLLKKEENKDPNALGGMLEAIDQGTTNS
ncbi:MAG: RraA family protein, partial [Acidobacteria bacterium]|nr:RraA family protein [Acidobacteriota bacterium]